MSEDVDALTAEVSEPIVTALCSDPQAVITEPVVRAVAEVYVRAALRARRATEYVEVVAKIHEAYRHLVMDTPEDRALHARLVATADAALDLTRTAPPTTGSEPTMPDVSEGES